MPHILMRFFTVPTAQAARISVIWAMAIIGGFYVLTLFLGNGAAMLVGPPAITAIDRGGNMAAPLLAQFLGGGPDSMLGNLMLSFVAAVAFATIVAVVAGLVLAAASAMSHDIWVGVIKGEHATDEEERRAARICSLIVGALAIVIGILAKGQNVAHLVALAFAVAASANLPVVLLTLYWKRCNTGGVVAGLVVGTFTAIVLVLVSPNMTYPLQVKAAQQKIIETRTRADPEAERRCSRRRPTRRRRRRSSKEIAAAEKAKAAAEATMQGFGDSRDEFRGAGEAADRPAEPGTHLDPARVPGGLPGIVVVPRQAGGGHLGRAVRAFEHGHRAGGCNGALKASTRPSTNRDQHHRAQQAAGRAGRWKETRMSALTRQAWCASAARGRPPPPRRAARAIPPRAGGDFFQTAGWGPAELLSRNTPPLPLPSPTRGRGGFFPDRRPACRLSCAVVNRLSHYEST